MITTGLRKKKKCFARKIYLTEEHYNKLTQFKEAVGYKTQSEVVRALIDNAVIK